MSSLRDKAWFGPLIVYWCLAFVLGRISRGLRWVVGKLARERK